jgi:hypothetical protein
MTNRESSQRTKAGRFGLGGDRRNVRIHFEPDGGQEVVDLLRFSLGHDFDSAVRKIADMAENFEVTGQQLAPEAETHALNPARVIDSATISRHRNPPRESRKPNNPVHRS